MLNSAFLANQYAFRQPPPGAGRVANNALTVGLTALLNPADGFINLVGGAALTNSGVTIVKTIYGLAYDSSGTRLITTVIELPFEASGAVSVVAVVARDITAGGGGLEHVQMLVTNADLTHAVPRWEANLGNAFGAGGDVDKCRFSTDAAGIGTIYVNGFADTGNNPGSTALVNGTLYNLAFTAASGASASSSGKTYIFTNGVQGLLGRIVMFALWNRELSASEVFAINKNPWALFKP